MVVLLTGASGFIGRHLARALAAAGHEVVRAQRSVTPGPGRVMKIEFTGDSAPADWLPRLSGIDAVVNAAGILRESSDGEFDAVHVRAPAALFDACEKARVATVVQISALGADGAARSRYHLSKKAADDHLASLELCGYIVQPSLVYGRGGMSAHLFDTLAALPLIPVPGAGMQRVQPVHIDDLVAVLLAMLESGAAPARGMVRVAVVGPEALRVRDFLLRLRRALELGSAPVIGVPMMLVRAAARLNDLTGRGLLDTESLAMLERGNTADAADTLRWLGRAPRGVDEFVAQDEASDARTAALFGWLAPLLRTSIALVWIVTGVISLGIFPVSESYALLARVGVTGMLATWLLYGAAVLDIALGVGVMVLRRRRVLWLAQMAVIAGYTAIISWKLPEFWLHPYGPVLKNLPILVAIALLYALERPR